MKKALVCLSIVLIASAGFVACGKGGSVKAGSATAESLVNLLPRDTTGVIVIDVHRAMTSEAVQKAIQDEKNKARFDKLMTQTGIDPQKDVYFAVIGLSGPLTKGQEPEGAFIANLKYDKTALLAKLKEELKKEHEGRELVEETYNGVVLFSGFDDSEKGKTGRGAFLDDSNIIMGSERGVKAVIDVFQKKAENLTKNADMVKIFKAANQSAMVWGAFAIPAGTLKSAAEQNPMMKNLENLNGVTLAFDYRNQALSAEIRAIGGSEEENKQVADMLTGLKALGAGAASKEPAIGEALNRIEIGASPDAIRLSINLPQDILDKLRNAAQSKVEGMFKPKTEESEGEVEKN